MGEFDKIYYGLRDLGEGMSRGTRHNNAVIENMLYHQVANKRSDELRQQDFQERMLLNELNRSRQEQDLRNRQTFQIRSMLQDELKNPDLKDNAARDIYLDLIKSSAPNFDPTTYEGYGTPAYRESLRAVEEEDRQRKIDEENLDITRDRGFASIDFIKNALLTKPKLIEDSEAAFGNLRDYESALMRGESDTINRHSGDIDRIMNELSSSSRQAIEAQNEDPIIPILMKDPETDKVGVEYYNYSTMKTREDELINAAKIYKGFDDDKAAEMMGKAERLSEARFQADMQSGNLDENEKKKRVVEQAQFTVEKADKLTQIKYDSLSDDEKYACSLLLIKHGITLEEAFKMRDEAAKDAAKKLRKEN